ncbi:MAG: hypothetical protein KI791_08890 [Cyclobacteriaceae bacterium]|nr:hypothetical protein [Cyclobacteriaceae bacterium SS2]
MITKADIPPGKYLIHDRFGNQQYLISQKSYQYILDMIKMYHIRTYEFPDWDNVPVEMLLNEDKKVDCQVPINRLVFN